MSLDRLRLWLRQYKMVRNARLYLLLLGCYLRSLPAWVHWQRRRRQGRSTAVQRSVVRSPSAPLHIVFVTRRLSPREFKLAHAARLCGHRVTLVTPHVQSSDMITRSFDAHYQADNPWKILALLDELRPDVTHLFVTRNNNRMLPVLLYAPSPVVYDPYDCSKGMFKPEYQTYRLELETERICFARADHICSRSLEPLYLRRHFGYRMPTTTYFPEYCWHPPQQRESQRVRDDEELHVVYCGGVLPEDRFSAAEAGSVQYIEVGRALSRQRIHLHIYPAPQSHVDWDDFFSLYLQEDASNPYFHLHRTLPYPELMREMTQYDAALHIAGATINKSLGQVTRAKLDYSAANKLFDYVEAGLPVIIHDGKHQRGLVRHYGLTVEVDDISLVHQALIEVMNREKRCATQADIAQHVERLGDMYIEVARSCAR